MLAIYTYCLYALGPILAFLRAEVHLSYTLASLHSSLWAVGTIVTGLTFDRIAHRIGRRRLLWLSAAGAAAGALMFVVGHAVVLTLAGAAVLGTAGTLMQTGSFGVLSDRHGRWRDRVLIEGTLGASASAVLAPLVLGGFARTPAGWRIGMLLPAAGLCILYLLFRTRPSVLKNSFALCSAPGSGAEYTVFVVFWRRFRALFESRPGRLPLFQQAGHICEMTRGLSSGRD